jgi:hypothetical protein
MPRYCQSYWTDTMYGPLTGGILSISWGDEAYESVTVQESEQSKDLPASIVRNSEKDQDTSEKVRGRLRSIHSAPCSARNVGETSNRQPTSRPHHYSGPDDAPNSAICLPRPRWRHGLHNFPCPIKMIPPTPPLTFLAQDGAINSGISIARSRCLA